MLVHLEVQLEMRHPREALGAGVALEGLFSRVHLAVVDQVPLVAEGLYADLALVGPLACVRSDVAVEVFAQK